MGMRSKLMTGILAASLSLSGAAAFAQDASPAASPMASPAIASDFEMQPINIASANGKIVGVANISQKGDTVTFRITGKAGSGLTPGDHGIHIHSVGSCDASGTEPFASAGKHFNPDNGHHGAPDDPNSHAGDLGNLKVNEDGSFSFEISTNRVDLNTGSAKSLSGPKGASIVIHEKADDLKTDPSGNSGKRVACGVIFRSVEPALNATPPAEKSTPVASPAATPAK